MTDNFLKQLQDQPLATVADYYTNCLATSPTAIAYLQRNALLSKQTSTEEPAASALRLTVGFCDRTLGKHIPNKQVKLGRHIRTQLEQLGIYRTSGHEHFRGMVTVPLHTTSGELTGLYGRRIDRHGEGQAEHVIGCGIFNAAAIEQFDELIIADTVLDAWTLCAAGHSNAICTVDYQLQIAELSTIKRVLLCGDSIDCDAFAGCELHRMSLPIGHTCHSYALERRAESAPLAKLIRAAAWQHGSCSAMIKH